MPFELNLKHSVDEDVRDLMQDQIARIEAHLRSTDGIEKRVHDVRKRTKETRALLRLVRSGLGSHFRIENLWYRDAARELASARNAVALVESMKKLRKHTAGRQAQRALRQVQHALQHIAAGAAQLDDRIGDLLGGLVNARARLEAGRTWPNGLPRSEMDWSGHFATDATSCTRRSMIRHPRRSTSFANGSRIIGTTRNCFVACGPNS